MDELMSYHERCGVEREAAGRLGNKAERGRKDMEKEEEEEEGGKEGVDVVLAVERSRRCALPLSCLILKPYYRLLHYSDILRSESLVLDS